MNLKLENRRVLVTGSTSGIGEGIARRFAQEGVAVIIHGRRREAAERVAAEIRLDGGKAIIALGDLSQDDEVTHIVEIAQAELGGVDILVNNAASGEHQNDMETTQQGTDYRTIQEAMGHHNVAFTLDVYSGVTDKMKQEATDKIGSLMASCLGKN